MCDTFLTLTRDTFVKVKVKGAPEVYKKGILRFIFFDLLYLLGYIPDSCT